MLAFEREGRPLIVIEQRGFPLGGVVAVAALGCLVCIKLRELASVDVLVALFTLLRSLLKVHVGHLGFEVRRFVAVDTCHRTVRPDQGERSCSVIKPIQFSPRLGAVAGLATQAFPVRPGLNHTVLELAVMGIGVTSRA